MERDIWDIWPGDFVKDNTGCVGFVETVGVFRFGTHDIPGYMVRTSSGKLTFMETLDAQMVSPTYDGPIGERRLADMARQIIDTFAAQAA